MSNNKDFKIKNGIKPTAYQETLGTVVSGSEGYSISSAAYDSVSFNVSAQDGTPLGLFFKPDGTKMYVVGFDGQDVNEYNLSTAWDISTASYSQNFSTSTQEISPKSVYFKSDGLKMYIVGYTGDAVHEYNLSTAWDISTSSFVQSFSVSSQDAVPMGLFFKTDGTKMFISGNSTNSVYEYGLSTAWNVSTASFTQSFSVATQDTGPYGLSFKPDGTKMYVSGIVAQAVHEYSLSTAWNISTAVSSLSFSTSTQDTSPQNIFFKSDGLKMYLLGGSGKNIYQYSTALSTAQLDLSTGSVFDYTPTSNVQVTLTNPAASGTASGATLLLGSEDSTGVGSTFSTTLYTGNGGTQTITNGIDLAGDGGMVWGKIRSAVDNHWIVDSENGIGSNGTYNYLEPSLTTALRNFGDRSVKTFNSNGFTLANSTNDQFNLSSATYVSWTFKKKAKFFDIVTWTGDNAPNRQISHSLNTTIGSVFVKCTSASSTDWMVYHKDSTETSTQSNSLVLNHNYALLDWGAFGKHSTQTSSVFTLGSATNNHREFFNESGSTYVAYLFAHDTDASSLIQCGTCSGESGSNRTINLGWEPQWLLTKSVDASGDWTIVDTQRGFTSVGGSGNSARLKANSSVAEDTTDGTQKSSTGFYVNGLGGSGNYIYMAIRNSSIPTITYDPNLQWSGGTAPTAPATGEKDVITFNTTDGGTTYKSALALDGAK